MRNPFKKQAVPKETAPTPKPVEAAPEKGNPLANLFKRPTPTPEHAAATVAELEAKLAEVRALHQMSESTYSAALLASAEGDGEATRAKKKAATVRDKTAAQVHELELTLAAARQQLAEAEAKAAAGSANARWDALEVHCKKREELAAEVEKHARAMVSAFDALRELNAAAYAAIFPNKALFQGQGRSREITFKGSIAPLKSGDGLEHDLKGFLVTHLGAHWAGSKLTYHGVKTLLETVRRNNKPLLALRKEA